MSELWSSVVSFLDEVGECSGCHRMPERSFFYKGHQFPVCARCTGVFFGQIGAVICGIFCRVPFAAAAICLSVMGFDWGIQELGIRESTNRRRFVTGVLGGFGLFSMYAWAVKLLFRKIVE